MKAPTFLGKIAKKKWADLVASIPTLTERDTDALSLLCMSWQNYLIAQKNVEEKGQVLDCAANGRLFINPAVNASDKAWSQIVQLSELFGLIPDNEASKPEPVSPFKKIIEKR